MAGRRFGHGVRSDWGFCRERRGRRRGRERGKWAGRGRPLGLGGERRKKMGGKNKGVGEGKKERERRRPGMGSGKREEGW